jgi:hypothetical protein
MVAYHKHPRFTILRHLAIPLFGLFANLACMAFYLIGPSLGYGTKLEPLLALSVAIAWAAYGWLYFALSTKRTKRSTLVGTRPSGA